MMSMNLYRAGAALLAAVATLTATARELSPEEALARAEGAMGLPASRSSAYVRARAATDTPYYIFNRTDGRGYLVTPTDSRLRAVLAVADEGELDPASMPPQLQWWLGQMEAEIESYLATDPAEQPEGRAAEPAEQRADIKPLVKALWAQGDPFNLRTPKVDGRQCATGCVATAMSQIIYTIGHIEPKGKIEFQDPTGYFPAINYDFDNCRIEPDKMLPVYDSSASREARLAVAELMAACGAAVKMNYSPGESGASDLDVAPGLSTYLGYDPEHTVALSRYNPSTGKNIATDKWQEIIYNEVAAGRPVYYGGQTPQMGGHGFVCDGYRSPGLFHFNWGWAGSSNGYYALSAMNPGDDGINSSGNGYNCLQTIVLVVPPGAKDTQDLSDIYQKESEGSFVVTDLVTDLVAEERGTVSFTIINTGDVEFHEYLYARIFDKGGNELAYQNALARPIPVGDIARFTIALELKGDKGETIQPGEYLLRLTDGRGKLIDPRAEIPVTVAAKREADEFIHPQGGFSITNVQGVPDLYFAGRGQQIAVNYRLDASKNVSLYMALCRPGTDDIVARAHCVTGMPPVAWNSAIRPFDVTFRDVEPGVYDLAFFDGGTRCSARKRVRVGFVADRVSYVANPEGETLSVAPGSYSRTVRIPATVTYGGKEWAVTSTEPEVWMGGSVRRLYLPATMAAMGRDALRYALNLEAVFFESEKVPFEYHQYVAHGLAPEADIFVPSAGIGAYAAALPRHNVWSTLTEVSHDGQAIEVGAGESRKALLTLLPSAAGAIDRWTVTSSDESVATGEAILTAEGVEVCVTAHSAGSAELTVTSGQPDLAAVKLAVTAATTGIDSVTEDSAAPKGIYDLAGRKLTRITSPGVYIIDGKKTVVR